MKIAAICGAPNQNSGMMFVDRALHVFLNNKKLIDSTTFFCFEFGAKNKRGFNYEAITKEVDFNDYDCIIIWGDFIISHHFLSMTQPKISKKSELLNYDVQAKILMRDLSEDNLKKVIVIGQCIAIDDVKIIENKSYVRDLKRLLEHAGLLKVRDPLSAYRAKLFSDVDRDFLGLDAALFNYALDKDKINEYKNNITKKDKISQVGIFFGRSKKMNFKKKVLGYYLKYMIKNVSFKWIPWLENKQQSKVYFNFANSCSPYTDIDYIKEILECDVVLTDTYHLSLMSWSLGVPCICYGNSSEKFKLTTHDKKKEIFFMSNFIDEYYFYTENFYRDLKNKVLQEVIKKSFTSNIGKVVSLKIADLAKMNIRELTDTIDFIHKK